MKTFKGNRPLHEILKQCKDQCVPVDRRRFDEGWDHIIVGDPNNGYVLYNTFNGRFFGQTPEGLQFSSDETVYDNEDWFIALLNFFYK